jgi:hypothetical protein
MSPGQLLVQYQAPGLTVHGCALQIKLIQDDKREWHDKAVNFERRSQLAEDENKRLKEDNQRLREEIHFLRTEVLPAVAL